MMASGGLHDPRIRPDRACLAAGDRDPEGDEDGAGAGGVPEVRPPTQAVDTRKAHKIRYQTAYVIVYCCGKNERLKEGKYRVARGGEAVTCAACFRRSR